MPFILAVFAIVMMNVAATVKVLWENRGPRFVIGTHVDDPRPRRWGQVTLVWLLPVIGAFIIYKLYEPVRPRPLDSHDPADPNSYVMQGGP